MNWFLFIAAVLHTGFMLGELFAWPNPLLLQLAVKKLPPETSFTSRYSSGM